MDDLQQLCDAKEEAEALHNALGGVKRIMEEDLPNLDLTELVEQSEAIAANLGRAVQAAERLRELQSGE